VSIARRRLGATGPWLSEITFGTMRMPAAVDASAAADHLCLLHDQGIDTHHSSYEYESHGRYREALSKAKATGREFQHIVKLSEPSFDADRFNGKRLSALLDAELSSLDIEQVASLQWLFRTPDAQNSEGRIATMAEQADEIGAWIEAQTKAGKVANVSVFPYSVDFATAAIDLGLSDTLATYLNLAELDYVPLLDGVEGFIAIRPLAGGRLAQADPDAGGDPPPGAVDISGASAYLQGLDTAAERAAAAISFSLLHPAVTTTVVSVSSTSHLESLVQGVAGQQPDQARFNAIVSQLGGEAS